MFGYAKNGQREVSIDGELITRARFPLPERSGFRYLRFEVIDEYGRQA